jgi:ankyrin repeat protein
MENLWEASLRGNLTSIRRSINLYGSQKVNEYDQKGITPLFLAASENKLDAVELLVACGADVNLRSKVRQHPLTLEQELSL